MFDIEVIIGHQKPVKNCKVKKNQILLTKPLDDHNNLHYFGVIPDAILTNQLL